MRFGLLTGVLLSLVPCTAQAGVRWSIGVGIGLPPPRYCGPVFYPRPYPLYYAPVPVIVQPAPVVAVGAVATVPAAPAVAGAAYETAELPPAPPAQLEAPRPTVRSARPVSSEVEALKDTNPQKRAEAILRMGRNKDRGAVSSISQALKDDGSAEVREAAARALGLIGSPQGLQALQQAALGDKDRDVRRSASFAAEVIRANMKR